MVKKCVDDCQPFRPVLSALQIPTYRLAKFLVPYLEPLTNNQYLVKDLFNFSTKIIEHNFSNFMGSQERFPNIRFTRFTKISLG